jgi:hypothetical protein
LFFSHEKKLKEARQKLSEAEKVGADLSELKAALQELQHEGDKIKQKEDEIKKKEKVCLCNKMFCFLTIIIYTCTHRNIKISLAVVVENVEPCILQYWLYLIRHIKR